MAGFGQVASKGCNWQNDVALPDPPKDSISGLSWSPASNHLAVSAWDNSVRIYEVGQQAAQGGRIVGGYEHSQPALDVCWSNDGSKVFSGGVDNAARMLDVQTGTSSQVASHNAPVRSVRWTDMHNGLLVTASWDKTLKVSLQRWPSSTREFERQLARNVELEEGGCGRAMDGSCRQNEAYVLCWISTSTGIRALRRR